MSRKKITRRQLLRHSVGAAAVFSIVPRHVLGGPGHKTPSETLTRGVVGTGGMGTGAHVTENKEGEPPVTLAVCDVDENHLNRALGKTQRGCKGYKDFRYVIERKDIDTIHIATPPHWHALVCIAAAQAGKDILCEKPMHRFIREGQAVIDAVKRYGRVFQIGTYGRFGHYHGCGSCRDLRKLIASGLLGNPVTVRVYRSTGFNWKVAQWSGHRNPKPRTVPNVLDYDFWLGPAPVKPYHPHRVHGSFRGYWDYDGGGLSDMGQHYLDPVQYFLGKDHTNPVEIEAYAPWPAHPDACGLWGNVRLKYEDGTTIIIESGEWGRTEQPEDGKELPVIKGSKGRVYANKRTDPPGLFEKLSTYPDPEPMIDFRTAVRTRRQSGGNAKVSHRSACLLHLANAAIRTGRKLRYDPVAQKFIGDAEANRLVDVPMRAPWHL